MVLLMSYLLAGCMGQQVRTKSSVMDYLYPKDSSTVVEPSIPTLNIPLKVGIAFVPEQASHTRGMPVWANINGSGGLTEAKKVDILDKVAEHFQQLEFVSEIEVIPSAYLTAGGGFSNLDQIRTMYGVDVIALVSYDQVQFTDEGALSLTYWTLVGAYVVSGEKNDTNTMMDTVVFDIQSRKMLFRAPGTSMVKGTATPINLREQLREDSAKSFELAATNMVANLDLQLERFREKLKKNPEKANVVYRKGYSGGGALGLFELSLMMLVSLTLLARRAHRSLS